MNQNTGHQLGGVDLEPVPATDHGRTPREQVS
jgi:hypothetical protein